MWVMFLCVLGFQLYTFFNEFDKGKLVLTLDMQLKKKH